MSEKMEKINRLKQSLENAESEISGLKNKVSEQNSTAEKNEKEFLLLVNQLQAQNLELQNILIKERNEDFIEDAEYEATIERLQNENSNLTVQKQELLKTIKKNDQSFETERQSLQKEIRDLLQSLMMTRNKIEELNASILTLGQQEQHTHGHLMSVIGRLKQILLVHEEIMYLCEKLPDIKTEYPFYNITTSLSDSWLMQSHETVEEWDERLVKILTKIKKYKADFEEKIKENGKTSSISPFDFLSPP